MSLITLTDDMRLYTQAHMAFVNAACRPHGVNMFGEESPEYNRLESAYNRLVYGRPLVRAFIGTTWGMRMLLSWAT